MAVKAFIILSWFNPPHTFSFLLQLFSNKTSEQPPFFTAALLISFYREITLSFLQSVPSERKQRLAVKVMADRIRRWWQPTVDPSSGGTMNLSRIWTRSLLSQPKKRFVVARGARSANGAGWVEQRPGGQSNGSNGVLLLCDGLILMLIVSVGGSRRHSFSKSHSELTVNDKTHNYNPVYLTPPRVSRIIRQNIG